MCYLMTNEKMYNTAKAYWKALMVNMNDGFTLEELLAHKENPTEEDESEVREVIRELGDFRLVKRIGERFYISNNTLVNV
ncbi:MAG: hypothetical protein IJ766_11145 [Clostridia bacterium]|nr:hypothetical protein [Clostridia bacterium]